MQLNMHILNDELEAYSPEANAGEGTELDLCGVRGYSPGSCISPDHAYLVRSQDLAAFIAQAELLSRSSWSLILLSSEDDCAKQVLPADWKTICISGKGCKYEYVNMFTYLQSIFERYSTWQEDVLKEAMSGEDLQSAFNLAASMLKNPVALIDNDQTLVVWAGPELSDTNGSIWFDLLENGFARLEYLSKHQQNELSRRLWDREDPFFLEKVAPYRDNRHLIAPLHNEGKPFAMFGMSDLLAPISLGQISLVRILQSLMKHILLSEIGKQHLGDQVGYYIDRILQGYMVEKGAVAYSLALRRWHLKDDYLALFMRVLDPADFDEDLVSVHAMRVQNLLPNCMAFPYDHGILALLRNPQSCLAQQDLEKLDRLCGSLGLYCGMSMTHTGFLQIREAYIQAKAALEYGVRDESRLVSFQDNYAPYLVGSLAQSADLTSFCHPKVLRLWLSGGEKGRLLVDTLHNYLVLGNNTNATARAMGLHRNTVIYRMERLREIFGNDLDAVDTNIHLMLALSCIFVRQVEASRRNSGD